MANNGFWDVVNELPKEELIDILAEYDDYLEQAREQDWFHQGWRPVSVAEFYHNEYQMVLEHRAEVAFESQS